MLQLFSRYSFSVADATKPPACAQDKYDYLFKFIIIGCWVGGHRSLLSRVWGLGFRGEMCFHRVLICAVLQARALGLPARTLQDWLSSVSCRLYGLAS